MMLTLRTNIGLTQAGLADRLGVSRRAVAEWEAGSTYPKAEHLKAFLALCVQQQAFTVGHEAEEIHALWKAAHQKEARQAETALEDESRLSGYQAAQGDQRTQDGRSPQKPAWAPVHEMVSVGSTIILEKVSYKGWQKQYGKSVVFAPQGCSSRC